SGIVGKSLPARSSGRGGTSAVLPALLALMCLESGDTVVAPPHPRCNRGCIERPPSGKNPLQVFAFVERRIGIAQPAETCTVAPAIVGNAARRIELDGLERPHE